MSIDFTALSTFALIAGAFGQPSKLSTSIRNAAVLAGIVLECGVPAFGAHPDRRISPAARAAANTCVKRGDGAGFMIAFYNMLTADRIGPPRIKSLKQLFDVLMSRRFDVTCEGNVNVSDLLIVINI